MAFVVGIAAKGVAMGIGLASEGIHAHKEKKRSKKFGPNESHEEFESNEAGRTDHLDRHEPLESERADYEGDEAHWNLDEVQEELQLSRAPNQKQLTDEKAAMGNVNEVQSQEQRELEMKKRNERDITVIIAEFVHKYPAPPRGPGISLPVILPQRRPKGRARGFIRAYAPVLMDCGIDPPMFIDFLDTFNRATLASPKIQLINLAGLASFAIAPQFSILLTVAIQIAIKTATELDGRSRTNAYLDGMNDQFFRPRGLFCLVLTWNPDEPGARLSVDTNTLVASSLEHKTGFQKYKTSNGNTYGDFEFPEAAPLVFPALDEMAVQEGGEAVGAKAKLKRAGNFTSDYLDRRARAAYAAEHPNSLLAQGPKDKFTSRYADPNNPASSGNPWSLISGGKFNPPMGGGLGFGGGFEGGFGRGFGGSGRRLGYASAGTRANYNGQGRKGQEPTYNASHQPGYGANPNSQRGVGSMPMGAGGQVSFGFGGLAPVGKAFKKIIGRNVLYLMIVNMPTDEEMTAAVATADKQGWNTGSGVSPSEAAKYNGPDSSKHHPWTRAGLE